MAQGGNARHLCRHQRQDRLRVVGYGWALGFSWIVEVVNRGAILVGICGNAVPFLSFFAFFSPHIPTKILLLFQRVHVISNSCVISLM